MSSAATEEPLAPLTVKELVALLATLQREGEITSDTPVALSSDAEGNAFRWLMGWSTGWTRYSTAQFPYSLSEEDRTAPALADPQEYLILFPAD